VLEAARRAVSKMKAAMRPDSEGQWRRQTRVSGEDGMMNQPKKYCHQWNQWV
jgi:hypothetical protein